MRPLLRGVALAAALSILVVGCAGRVAAPNPNAPDAGATVAPTAPAARSITLIRSPSCGCCGGHEAHLLRAGYDVSSQLTDAYVSVKDAHEIPAEMRSCHTSLIGRYFVEGHVPVAAIEQLMTELPAIDGIALPGMPPGSPGMEGTAEGPLTIFAIDDGRVVGEFGRFEAPLEE